MKRRIGLRTALLLIARHLDEEPLLPARGLKPEVNDELLVRRGTNPRKQRKGKSGEIPRRGPR